VVGQSKVCLQQSAEIARLLRGNGTVTMECVLYDVVYMQNRLQFGGEEDLLLNSNKGKSINSATTINTDLLTWNTSAYRLSDILGKKIHRFCSEQIRK
jgi:hypothetical protein